MKSLLIIKRRRQTFWVEDNAVASASFTILENLPILSEMAHEYKATRHIRSLYFDADNNTLYKKFVNEAVDNAAYRIRWYDTHSMEQRPYLEKISYDFALENEQITQIPLDLETIDKIIGNHAYKHIDARFIDKTVSSPNFSKDLVDEMLSLNLRPAMLIEHDRVVYANPKEHLDLRVEMDSNIQVSTSISEFLHQNGANNERAVKIRTSSVPFNICRMIYIENQPMWMRKFGLKNDKIILVENFDLYVHCLPLLSQEVVGTKPRWQNRSEITFNNKLIDIDTNGTKTSFLDYVRKLFFTDKKTFNNAVLSSSKSFFASERTFIQWANASALLAASGASLIAFYPVKNYSAAEIFRSAPATVGFGYCLLAIILILYNFVLYNMRMRNLAARNKSPVIYVNRFAPTLMSVFATTLLLLTLGLNYY